MIRFKDDDFVRAFFKHKGNAAAVGRELGVNRQRVTVLYQMMRRAGVPIPKMRTRLNHDWNALRALAQSLMVKKRVDIR